MTTQVTAQFDADSLIDEIRRYLGAVEAFRAEGCQPQWRGESTLASAQEPRQPAASATPRARLERG